MNGIAFASPWVLAAAAALAVPVLAHLARHEDRKGRGFPSLMFLSRVPFPARARHRLQDRPLLALRALALLALVLAFAGIHPTYEAGAADGGPRDTVVLLDVSYSMGAGDRFAEARRLAAAAIDEAGADERVALVLFDEQARVVSPLDAGAGAAREALARVLPGHRATDFTPALLRASRLLGSSRAGVRRVVMVSDLQAVGLKTAPRLAGGVRLDLRPVTAPLSGNRALTGAWLLDAAGGEGNVLRVRVRNDAAAATAASLRVWVNGLEAGARALDLAAGETRDVDLPVFPARDAATRIAVSLDDDALAADNQRFLSILPRRPLSALLVSEGDGAAYLAAALTISRQPPVVLERLAPGDVGPESFAGVDLLVLDAPIGDDPSVRDAVARRAVEGMGILAFASAAGGRSLFLPGLDGESEPASGLSLTPVAATHALSPVFGEEASSLGPVWRRVALRTAGEDQVLARFDDGAPAMLARTTEQGRSLLLATAPGDAWSALGRRPEFAPWLVRSAAWLAGVSRSPLDHAPGSAIDPARLAAGAAGAAPLARALEEGASPWVRDPSGSDRRLAPGALLVPDAPGFHALRAGAGAPLWVAVSVDARESDLAAVSPEAFMARLRTLPVAPAGAQPSSPGPEPDPRPARWLAVLGAGLLLLEGLLAGAMARRARAVAA